MKSIWHATGLLAASSSVTVLAGVGGAKVWAVLVGPPGIGYMGLLQSLLGLTSLLAGLGVSAAIVRLGASPAATGDDQHTAALRRAAWITALPVGCLACCLLLLFRAQVSEVFLGSSAHEASVPMVAVALMLALIAGVQTGFLNSEHRVGALAKYAAYSAVVGTAIGMAIIWRLKQAGIPFALAAGPAAACVIATVLARRELRPISEKASIRQVWSHASALVRFGVPYTASMLVGTGVSLMMPVLVLHLAGSPSVGYYRAAAAIGIAYLGFLLAAMSQDYFPRVSAAHDRPAELRRMVNNQQRMLMLLAMPIIFLVLSLAPVLVPILYSSKFGPTSSILEWQLMGDVLRLSSWTMAYVVLARKGAGWFFATELIGGSATLGASWIGMLHFGVMASGIGYLLGYVVYASVVWGVARRDIGLRFTWSNRIIFTWSIFSVALVKALPLVGFTAMQRPGALLFGTAFGVYSLRAIAVDINVHSWIVSRAPLRARPVSR